MIEIELKKKHFKRSKNLVVSPNWISNGHWMIHKEKVKNYKVFEEEDIAEWFIPPLDLFRKLEEENMERCLVDTRENKKPEEFTIAGWHHGFNEKLSSAFKNTSGEIVMFDKLYVDLFNLASLFSIGDNRYVDDVENPSFVLMAMHTDIEDQDKRRQELFELSKKESQ